MNMKIVLHLFYVSKGQRNKLYDNAYYIFAVLCSPIFYHYNLIYISHAIKMHHWPKKVPNVLFHY